MKTLVIYDSVYGNTERIAKVIGKTLHADALCVDEVGSSRLKGLDLLIVGSPVHEGRATPLIEEFIKNTPSDYFAHIKFATIETAHCIKPNLALSVQKLHDVTPMHFVSNTFSLGFTN